jgi:hypothetical protein
MYKWVHRFAWAAMAAMFCYNFFFWGGLARIQSIGPRLDLQSQRTVSNIGVALYAQSGRDMMNYIAPNTSREHARAAIGEDVIEDIAINPGDVPKQLRNAMPWYASFAYYGAPIMLLVSLILYWLRPKTIRSFGS